jgi:hypothetical protein
MRQRLQQRQRQLLLSHKVVMVEVVVVDLVIIT